MTRNTSHAQDFDWQGHRGARGLLPENSLPSFEKALELGVTTLEMDLVVSKDRQLVVSHDPWMNPSFCLLPSGQKIDPEDYRKYNIFKMDYEEVKSFDCGSIRNSRFPEQQPEKTYKPLLKEVFKLAEKYCKDHMRNEIHYNIEVKIQPDWEGELTPSVEEFSKLVFDEVDAYVPWSRTNIQSFDLRILKYFHENYPHVKLAVLVEGNAGHESILENLGFTPQIYSPHYSLLDKKTITDLHRLGMSIIPWTVNDTDTMNELVNWDVDGIITDYPNKIFDVSR
ncbi:glycerophosphodiester phosphodiesterase family protein [Bacteroidota bacterium]